MLLLPTATYRTAAFVEAARHLEVDLTVASERPSAFEQAQPVGLITLELGAPSRAADQVEAFSRLHPIHGVVGVDDDTAIAAAAIAARQHLRGNPEAAALAARDKHLQRQILARAHVPVPTFALHRIDEDPTTIARGVSFPCVLKPLRLSASRGVIRADTAVEFVSAFGRLKTILEDPEVAACGEPARRLLVERFVPGAEVALEGLVTGGSLDVLALFDKPDPLDGPFFEETIYVTPSRLPSAAQTAIAGVARAAVRALGLTDGPVHAELRYNDQGPWLIEMAARPIGGRCSGALRFRLATGDGDWTSLEEVVLRHALGMELGAIERESAAAGVMMIPVPGAGVLREVRGVESARAVPGVDDVTITAHRGQRLVPLPEGSRYPGFIFARGERPEQVETALREAYRRLEFVLERE